MNYEMPVWFHAPDDEEAIRIMNEVQRIVEFWAKSTAKQYLVIRHNGMADPPEGVVVNKEPDDAD